MPALRVHVLLREPPVALLPRLLLLLPVPLLFFLLQLQRHGKVLVLLHVVRRPWRLAAACGCSGPCPVALTCT